jgi:hypothetical protein
MAAVGGSFVGMSPAAGLIASGLQNTAWHNVAGYRRCCLAQCSSFLLWAPVTQGTDNWRGTPSFDCQCDEHDAGYVSGALRYLMLPVHTWQ